jgi:3-methylcrotonyl-CoA carboxylase alpha subunit/acetyl-CoA/propionyl-CoA carboxylase biotin carboxyl carrier protein
MLAKLTVHAATREAARGAMVAALDDCAVFGVTTNLGFLRRLVAADAFAAAEIDTGWLDREPDAFTAEPSELALVAAAWSRAQPDGAVDPGDPFGVADGWRLGAAPSPTQVELLVGDDRRRLRVDRGAGTVAEGARSWAVRGPAARDGRLSLEVDGALHTFEVAITRHAVTVGHEGAAHVFARPEPFGEAAEDPGRDGSVAAPMPGKVLEVAGAEGDDVEAGQTVVVIEAMKMELSLEAPLAGRIEEIRVARDDQVALGDIVFVVAAPEDEEG